jgi:hypothetical protein
MSKCRICIAALQHYVQGNNTTSLFVVFDWPIQRRTDWAVFLQNNPEKNVTSVKEETSAWG